jgi:hypothetical protein
MMSRTNFSFNPYDSSARLGESVAAMELVRKRPVLALGDDAMGSDADRPVVG